MPKREKERVCLVTPEFPVLGGMRSVLMVLLSLLAEECDPVVLARKFGESGYRHYDLSFSPKVRSWFSPWFLSTLAIYEISGLLWCLLLRVAGVRKFLVQDAIFSGLFVTLVSRLPRSRFYLFDYGAIVNLDSGLLKRELVQAQPPVQAKLQLRIMRLIRWISLRSCSYFFVHSPRTKELAIASGLPSERILEYGFPLDSTIYRKDSKKRASIRKKFGLNSEFCILYAGRMTLDKGLPILVEAFSKLNRRDPHGFRMILLGGGPEEAMLRRMVANLRLEGVTFVSAVDSPSRVAELMNAADVFVYPIVLSGGVAMAVLEAMACELPVVVGPAGPTKDLIADRKNGFVMKEEKAEEIVDAIHYLLDHPRLRDSIGKRAQETVVRQFGLDQYRSTVVARIQNNQLWTNNNIEIISDGVR